MPFVVGRLALDVERTLEPERVTVGDRAVAVVRVTNPRRTPIASRTIEEHVGGRPLRLDIPPLGAGRATEAVYTLPTARRGVVTVGPALIVKSDLLGLMRREIVQTGTQTLWVHPRVDRRCGRCRSASPRTSRVRRRMPRRPATSPSTPCASTSSATTTATSTGCRRRAPAR